MKATSKLEACLEAFPKEKLNNKVKFYVSTDIYRALINELKSWPKSHKGHKVILDNNMADDNIRFTERKSNVLY